MGSTVTESRRRGFRARRVGNTSPRGSAGPHGSGGRPTWSGRVRPQQLGPDVSAEPAGAGLPLEWGDRVMLQRLSARRALGLLALLLILPVVALGLTSAPASAANISNATFRIPMNVMANPCYPADVVNLHGTIHVVTTVTADGSGGYHMTQTANSHLTGASIT